MVLLAVIRCALAPLASGSAALAAVSNSKLRFTSECVAVATSQGDLARRLSGTLNDVRQASDVAMSLCQRYGGRACVIVTRFSSTD
jgi:hypothetical protein